MTPRQAIHAPIVAILIMQTAALFARSFLRIELQERGYDPQFAGDLSYLIVPLILAVLMYPILTQHKAFLLDLFRLQRPGLRLVLAAIGVGTLMRIAWWCQLIVRISFGITSNSDPTAVAGPIFTFGCPPEYVLLLGLLVMAVLIPVIEEIVHRGLIQSSLVHRGQAQAIILSALIFSVFHPLASIPWTFIAGIILGIQFWNSGTLWISMITHATYNGLAQIDWRCSNGTWSPPASDLPLAGLGIASLIGLALSFVGIGLLIRSNKAKVR